MKKVLFIIVVLLAGCVMTPERQNYIDTIAEEPFVFEVPKRKTDKAWNRAINWITNYSSTSIQVISEDKIRTFLPPENSSTVGYIIQKREKKGNFEFTINCYGGASSFEKVTINCRSLVHYIRWGVSPPDGFIKP
jgi:hypothetical protein